MTHLYRSILLLCITAPIADSANSKVLLFDAHLSPRITLGAPPSANTTEVQVRIEALAHGASTPQAEYEALLRHRIATIQQQLDRATIERATIAAAALKSQSPVDHSNKLAANASSIARLQDDLKQAQRLQETLERATAKPK